MVFFIFRSYFVALVKAWLDVYHIRMVKYTKQIKDNCDTTTFTIADNIYYCVWIYISIGKRKMKMMQKIPPLMIGSPFPIPWMYKKFTEVYSVFTFWASLDNSALLSQSIWNTNGYIILCEKVLTFMNFHCNEACILWIAFEEMPGLLSERFWQMSIMFWYACIEM